MMLLTLIYCLFDFSLNLCLHCNSNSDSNFFIFYGRTFLKYAEIWYGIKNEIEAINSGKKGEYGKDFMKIKVNTDDKLPLNKPLKLHLLTITVRFIFEEEVKFIHKFI